MKSRFLTLSLLGPSLLTMTACGKSEAEVLSDHYRKFVEPTGSSAQQCAEGNKVADAWAREGNSEKYRQWKLRTDLDCIHARALAGAGL